jgi:hypothetical protein
MHTLIGKPEGKRPLGRSGRRWEDNISRVEVKLFLCFNRAPRHEGVLREWRYSSTYSLNSALDGGEWSASRPGRFTPGKERLVPIG